MACRRAVVVSRVGGLQEIVGHNESGLLVPPNDDLALAAAIDSLLSDPVQRGRLEAGAGNRAEAFDRQRNLRSYLDLFRSILMA